MTTLATPTPSQDQRATGAALAHLFDDHGRMVLGICRIYLSDEYEAEDAAQETFISAHRSLLSGCQPEQSGAWLAAIARNECRDRIRGLARRNTAATAPEVFEGLAHVSGDTLAENMDRGAALESALDDLPDNQREAFVLREMLGLRYDEIASALETTDSAVESLLVRARRTLREHLSGRRLAPVALVAPFALRESIAHAVSGFPLAPPAVGGVTSVSVSSGGGLGYGGTGGAGAQGGAVQASATQISGAATSGSVGTTAGSASALGTTAATSTAAAASSAPALVGVANVLATPILAKLAIAGAATSMVASMAVSKPWNVEPRSATPPTAAQTAPSGNASDGVAGTKVELASGDGGLAAGATRGLDDGTKNADADDKTKPKAKKKNGGTGNPAPAHEPAAPAAAPSPAPAERASTGDDAGVTSTIAKVSESGGQGKPPKTGNAAPQTGKTADPVPSKGNDTAAGAHSGDANPANGGSDAGSSPADSGDEQAQDTQAQGETPAPGEPAADIKSDADVSEKNSGKGSKNGKDKGKDKGKKRGHEADGPGNSNDAHAKKSGKSD